MAETFLYLTTIGRKSGNPHKIEIWFVEHEEHFYLCSGGMYQADWVQNIQQNEAVSFYLAQGKDVQPETIRHGTGRILADGVADDLRETVKGLFTAKYNWSNGLIVELIQSKSSTP